MTLNLSVLKCNHTILLVARLILEHTETVMNHHNQQASQDYRADNPIKKWDMIKQVDRKFSELQHLQLQETQSRKQIIC